MNPNYVQLKVNGKDKGFKFGLGFLSNFIEVTGIPVSEMGKAIQENPFKVVPIMMLESHKYNEKRAKRECDLTVDDFIDWIDEDGGFTGPLLSEFMNAWRKSMAKDVPIPEVDETKKKPQEKKMNLQN